MSDMKQTSIYRLVRIDSFDMNTIATTTVYTVPTGKKCVLDHIKVRNVSASLAAVRAFAGQVGTGTDFLPNTPQALTNINAAAATGILAPLVSATTTKNTEYPAATDLTFSISTGAGSGVTATLEYWGTLHDA